MPSLLILFPTAQSSQSTHYSLPPDFHSSQLLLNPCSQPQSLLQPQPYFPPSFSWRLEGRNRGDNFSAPITQPLLPTASQTKLPAPQCASSSHPPPRAPLLPFRWRGGCQDHGPAQYPTGLSRAERPGGLAPDLWEGRTRAVAQQQAARAPPPLVLALADSSALWATTRAFLPRRTSSRTALDSEPKQLRGLTCPGGVDAGSKESPGVVS